MQHKVVTGR